MLTFDAKLKDVDKLLFSPNGETLVIRERIDQTHVYNSHTLVVVAIYPGSGKMAFSHDSTNFAYERYEAIEVLAPGHAPIPMQDTSYKRSFWDCLRFSNDGKLLEASGYFTRGYMRWDAKTGQLLRNSCAEFGQDVGGMEGIDGTVEGLSYPIHSGRTLTFLTTKAPGKKPKGEAVIFEQSNKIVTIRIDNGGTLPNEMLITANGLYLILRWWRLVGIWNLETFVPVARISVDKKPFLDAALTPDGRQLVTVINNDTHVRFWDLASGELTVKYDWGIGKPTAVAVAPDGLRIACANAKGQVVIWDAK